VNYRFQRGERTIGKVLDELVGAGELRREEVVVATKGGYVTFDGTMPPNPRAWFEEKFVSSGLWGRRAGRGLALHDAALSRRDAGDEPGQPGPRHDHIYYIHNPETQLASIERGEFLERMRRAFEFLEQQVAAAKSESMAPRPGAGFASA